MTTAPRRYWQDMTTEEFAALDAGRLIAVLPVAAIEQHGPHLPVCVDSCINQGVLARAVELMPDDLPVAILPAMPVGKSNEHVDFPGTLTLSAGTLIRLWTEIGDSVARAGVRKLVLFNTHGGQRQLIEVAARDLRVKWDMFVVSLGAPALGKPPGLFDDDEVRHGIHAGTVETSMMLHLRPDLVKMDRARNFAPISYALERDYKYLRANGPISFGWKAQDLHPDGACGDAAKADAARGEALIDHTAAALVELLAEIDRYPLEAVKRAG